MGKWTLIVITVLFALSSRAQSEYTQRDSIDDAEVMYKFYYKTKFQIDLSHERTLLTKGVNVKMNLLKLGLQYRKNYKFGLLLGISRPYRWYDHSVDNVDYFETNISAFGGFFEYVFIENYRWYVGFPATIGSARINGEAINRIGENDPVNDFRSSRFGITSIGANGGYNINYWLSLTLGLGYRFTMNAVPEGKQRLSSPFYSYGVKFKLGHFTTSVFHKKRVNKMKSIYFREKDTRAADRFKKRHPELYK